MLLALCLLLTMLPSAGLAQEARFGSAEELTSWLYYDCAYMLADRIEFGYTQSLDYLFANGFPWKMLYSSGMIDMDVNIDRSKRQVTISNIEYSEGDTIVVGLYVKCAGSGNGAWGKIDDAMLNSVKESN